MTYGRLVVVIILTVAFVAFGAQFFIEFSSENIAASCFAFASVLAIVFYIYWTNAIQSHPLSTFAIFGFCVTTQLGALIVQSAAWTPLVLNLRLPVETFATLAFYQGIAMVAHSFYRLFSRTNQSRQSFLWNGLEKLGLYATPTAGTLWVMGLIGLFSFLLGAGGEGVSSKVFQGITFVAWAPFLIPMYIFLQGREYCDVKKNFTFLFVYAGLIALLGVAANARGLMLSGLMTIALFGLLRAMRSTQPVAASRIALVGLISLVLGALTIPVADLVTAMAIARKSRGYVSAVKMVEETIYYYQQPHQLEAYRQRDNVSGALGAYDERYIANPLMARLVETKFHDNALYFSSRVNLKDEEKMQEITRDFFWTTLPDPLLKALAIDVDKKDLRFSMGDYLGYLGGAGSLGGFKTGSVLGQGYAVFGYFFPLIYFIFCPILFWAHDLASYRAKNGAVLISALGMLSIWKLFQYGISAESLHHLFMIAARALPQSIVMFLIIYNVARVCAGVLDRVTGTAHPMSSAIRVQ